MKTTHHNVLALACALLLTVPVAPVAAGNRHKADDYSLQREQPGRAHAAPAPALLLAQNNASESSRGNKGKNADRNRNSRAPGSADRGNEAPSVSRSDAAEIAQRATGGRVLSVREDGRYWQVKVLVDEKRVRFVNVDKYSGRVR